MVQDKREHFKKMLSQYDVNYESGQLMQVLIEESKTAFIKIVTELFKEHIVIRENHKRSFLIALRKGNTHIIRHIFFYFRHQMRSIFIDPRILGDSNIISRVQQEVFCLLTKDILGHKCRRVCQDCRGMEIVNLSTRQRVLGKKTEEVFKIGLACLDINQQDDEGNSLLIYAQQAQCLQAIRHILEVDNLDVNHMNKAGRSALDFVPIPELKKQDPVDPRFQPVVNLITSAPFSSLDSSTTSIDLKIMLLFLRRQKNHKDVDFNFTSYPLLERALGKNKLDLARFLLTECNYKVTAEELVNARRLLEEGKSHGEVRRGLLEMLGRLAAEEGVRRSCGL